MMQIRKALIKANAALITTLPADVEEPIYQAEDFHRRSSDMCLKDAVESK